MRDLLARHCWASRWIVGNVGAKVREHQSRTPTAFTRALAASRSASRSSLSSHS